RSVPPRSNPRGPDGVGFWGDGKMASARSAAGLLALALIAAGCSTQSLGSLSSDPTPTGSLGEASLKDTALAAEAWRRDPSNKKNGLTYARGLMSLERSEEAVKVV